MYQGVDVSSNNNNGTGIVNFPAVKNAGRSFVMVRVGYGTHRGGRFSGYISRSFAPQISSAQQAGLETGVYWYSRATTEEEARIEAKACLDAIKPYQLTYPVVFDQEYESEVMALTRRRRTNICLAFLGEIQNAGYYPMMYASKDWFENWVYDDELKEYDHWVAQYASTLTYRGETSIWQYSGMGRLAEVVGPIDLDVSYRNYPKIIREGGYNHLTPIDYKVLYEEQKQVNQSLLRDLRQLLEHYQQIAEQMY